MSSNRRTRVLRLLASLTISAAIAVFALLSEAATARSDAKPALMVSITADGQPWDYVSSQPTVEAVLKEAGVTLGEYDEVHPGPNAAVSRGMKIRVVRVEKKTLVVQEDIKFKTVAKFDPYGVASRRMIQAGEPGKKEVTIVVTYRDGRESDRKAVSGRVIQEPVNEVVALSKSAFLASRSGSYMRVVRMVATGYAPFRCGGSRSGRTASGVMAGKGIVAVDPRFIPLGTKLYVDGYGFCIAGDTGGAIKGSRIDLGFDTYSQALHCGRKVVTVYILGRD